MYRRRSAVAVAVALAVVPSAFAQQDPRERQVLVSITGRNDAPTTGLTADAFEVREDGKPVEVVRVAPAPPPTHLALVVDDSGALGGLGVLQSLREALKGIAATAGKSMPGTQIALVGGADPPMMRLPFTADLGKAAPALEQFGVRPQAGGTLLEAISMMIGDLQQRKAARPVIVAFSAEDSSETARVKGNAIENSLRTSGTSLWAVVFQSRSTGGEEVGLSSTGDRSAVLADVTRRSGGVERRVNSNQGVTETFDRMVTMIASRYEVTYLRPAGATATPKNFEVRSRKGGTVAAPRWAGQ